MKRKIAAVLMADVAGPSGSEPERERLAHGRSVLRDVLARSGGHVLTGTSDDAARVAEFQSAVEAVRAAVDVQASLRARNKAAAADRQFEFKLAIAIGELVDGDGDLPEETLAAMQRLIGLATTGGLCISRSVRDAVVSKLKLHHLDLTIEGERPEPTSQHVAIKPQKRAATPNRFAVRHVTPNLLAVVALVVSAGAIALWLFDRRTEPPQSSPSEMPKITILEPARQADTKIKPPGGTLEFKPALAPDPSLVLTAQRMLPQAWRDCRKGSADKAVAACKLLLDSGIPKGHELAEIHLSHGKAFRDRRELDKALEAFGAALELSPTAAAYSLRGTVHYDKGSWDRAIADYSEAIRLEPANGETFNNRAWTYYRAGRNAEALADADMAVRLLATKAYVWDTRGHIHAKLGNRDAAAGDFRAALAIDPANAASKDGLANLGAN